MVRFIICFLFVGVQARASQSSELLLNARVHIKEYLSVCDAQPCQLSYDEKSWLRTTQHLAELIPIPEFKTEIEIEKHLFICKSKQIVWINENIASIQKISDAVVVWIEILLADKNISRVALSLLEFELTEKLDQSL